jgi:hypothetical protein
MKTTILAALLLTAAHASAGQCVTLDYQEMKEMSVEAVIAEYCKAQAAGVDSLIHGMKASTAGDRALSRTLGDQGEHCLLQVKRIERILIGKGIEKPAEATLCKTASSE